MRQQLGADLTWEWSQCRQKCFMLLLKVSTIIQFSDKVIHFLCERNSTKIPPILLIKLFSCTLKSWTVNCANTSGMDYFLVLNQFIINRFIRFDKECLKTNTSYHRVFAKTLKVSLLSKKVRGSYYHWLHPPKWKMKTIYCKHRNTKRTVADMRIPYLWLLGVLL
jgi:hypothetical protein